MAAVGQHSSMGFKSIIPADRIKIDGNPSRVIGIIYWAILDVYEYNHRNSVVNHVHCSGIKIEKFHKEGDGVVPLKVEISTDSKEARVIF